MQKNNFSMCEINPSVRPSFDETMDEIKEQIEYQLFPFELLPQVTEIAAIIAEMFRMRPEDRIKIENALHTVADVQSVYRHIRHEHVQHVLETFNAIPYTIRAPKMFLRTALYNIVFEHTSAENNLFSSTAGDGI